MEKETEQIKLAICDDSKQMCEFIEFICMKQSDIQFVGMAHGSEACIELVKKIQPNMLLLDIQMEEDNSGVLLIPKLKEISPQLDIIMLTVHQEDSFIFSALAEGASDYIIKTSETDEMLEIIRSTWQKQGTLRPQIANALLKQGKELKDTQKSLIMLINMISRLSLSEIEVLKAAYDGDSYKKIAEKRFVEEGTIRVLSSRILKKTGFSSMKKLVDFLRLHKIMDFYDSVQR